MNATETEESSQELLDYDSDGLSNVEEITVNADPCSQQGSFESGTELSDANVNATNNTTKSPFILVMMRSGGFTGESNILLVESISSKIIIGKNNNITEHELSEDLSDNLKRIVNNSKLFEANGFYPPPKGSADYIQFYIAVVLNGKSHNVSWTDVSKDVPLGVANLPYILDYILGGSW
jgi:hypothetical protein